MTVLMSDARAEVEHTLGDVLTADLVHELIYADDTLLIDARGQVVQAYMDAVVSVGAQYGLQINWKKVELMAVRCNPDISDNIGKQIGNKSGIVYLGALLDSSGSIQSELVRRIGMATSDFKALATIWNHSNLTQYWKHRVFHACIASKLLYGLQTAWLTKSQRNKLDGFQARCLRKIIRVAPSYWSRISNARVLATLDAYPLSFQLLEQRTLVFNPSSDTLRISSAIRRRGRPRLNWCQEVHKHAVLLSREALDIGLQIISEKSWKRSVRQYCRGPS